MTQIKLSLKLPTIKCRVCDIRAATEDLKTDPGYPNILANQTTTFFSYIFAGLRQVSGCYSPPSVEASQEVCSLPNV